MKYNLYFHCSENTAFYIFTAVKYSFLKICIIFKQYFPVFHYFVYNKLLYHMMFLLYQVYYFIRLRAKKGPAPPLGNFGDISYLEGNFKPHLLRDVCTLCSGALVSDSLLHMLL